MGKNILGAGPNKAGLSSWSIKVISRLFILFLGSWFTVHGSRFIATALTFTFFGSLLRRQRQALAHTHTTCHRSAGSKKHQKGSFLSFLLNFPNDSQKASLLRADLLPPLLTLSLSLDDDRQQRPTMRSRVMDKAFSILLRVKPGLLPGAYRLASFWKVRPRPPLPASRNAAILTMGRDGTQLGWLALLTLFPFFVIESLCFSNTECSKMAEYMTLCSRYSMD